MAAVRKYDAVIIGSGSGMSIVSESLAHGLKVALIDKGPMGGTCPNNGCIPSKMLIYAADCVMGAAESERVGIKAAVQRVDFPFIMKRMRESVAQNQRHMKDGVSHAEGLDFYEGTGRFVDEYTIEVNGTRLTGQKTFIASGSRPIVPPIKGLSDFPFLTSESLLRLEECPKSMIIVGGGYIAVEYGHFFAAMGTKVTMFEMADRLVLAEEPEVSKALQEALGSRVDIHTNAKVLEVGRSDAGVSVNVEEQGSGQAKAYSAESVLVAVGRRSNSDLLDVAKSGIETDPKGWIKVNDLLETSRQRIYSVGDANGIQMFTHVANKTAAIVADNAVHNRRQKMDYSATPHAVYSHPQIASVGMTEAEARKTHKVRVGTARYSDVAQGEAMMETAGFAKAIVDDETDKILGFHVVGPYAPILVQEVTAAMANGGDVGFVFSGMHIHPAITELIPRVLSELR